MDGPDVPAALAANRRHWERMAAEGCGLTTPWLDLDRDLLVRWARGEVEPPAGPLDDLFPASVLAGVAGKRVLCLAASGGQQSAVLGLLGAQVTVFDLAQGQLAGDARAAAHYGYEVTCVQGDMQDLSAFADGSFDLVYQAPSMAYVPDVRRVYGSVARVLAPGGTYRADAGNPAVQFVDEEWRDGGYRINVPYGQRVYERPDGAVEFRHYLSDTFNGLLAAGFEIRHVAEAPAHLRDAPGARPGRWEHVRAHLPWSFAVVATRR